MKKTNEIKNKLQFDRTIKKTGKWRGKTPENYQKVQTKNFVRKEKISKQSALSYDIEMRPKFKK